MYVFLVRDLVSLGTNTLILMKQCSTSIPRLTIYAGFLVCIHIWNHSVSIPILSLSKGGKQGTQGLEVQQCAEGKAVDEQGRASSHVFSLPFELLFLNGDL